jgi:hypothetical protein
MTCSLCKDCGIDTIEVGEYYMVKPAIWAYACYPETGKWPNGFMLCFGCLEDRIGRPLKRSDFTSAPINIHIIDLFPE